MREEEKTDLFERLGPGRSLTLSMVRRKQSISARVPFYGNPPDRPGVAVVASLNGQVRS